jgi:hypothetical protein
MPTRELLKEYYIHDRSIGSELGGAPVKARNKDRVVMLLPSQAEYWLDQGAIGDAAPPAKGHRKPREKPAERPAAKKKPTATASAATAKG